MSLDQQCDDALAGLECRDPSCCRWVLSLPRLADGSPDPAATTFDGTARSPESQALADQILAATLENLQEAGLSEAELKYVENAIVLARTSIVNPALTPDQPEKPSQ